MSKRVLLIDDEVALLQGLAPFLEDVGYEVLTATDAGAAMVVLRGQEPVAIVCDLRLPGVGGTEFYDAVQANPRWRKIPFVFVTGERKASVQTSRAGGGATRVLTKPFDPEDLVAILGEEVASQS